ncbi:MAG: hypothetical protein GVY16_10280 [Planctomycetes bacterium]|jgi:hypothetical protein|nr:CvpA family protein [Phycisphaerae bacterium]NBB96108.1 hypothetical protein [Planctomycetota bacterium]
MILVAATAILILGIGYFQMRQGLFSALLLATWTIISAGLAITCYEGLASTASLYQMKPEIAEGVALMLLFIVPLLLLRTVGNILIRGDIVFNVIIDRIGGGLFGLLTGMFAIGVLMIVIQMAPLGRNILIWRPFEDDLTRAQRLLPFYPDEAVLAFGEMLSGGSMRGSRRLADHHPHLLLEQFCGRNTTGRGGRVDAMPADFLLDAVYKLSEAEANTLLPDLPPYPLVARSAESDVCIVRVSIGQDAANLEDNWWRLPATQFRLLCLDAQGRPFDAYPVAYTFWNTTSRKRRKLEAVWYGEDEAVPAGLIVERPTSVIQQNNTGEHPDMLTVDWVYELPAGAQPKQCWFRRTVGAPVEGIREGFPAALHGEALRDKPTDR